MIRHGRQEELKECLEDDIVKLLCYRSIRGQLNKEELEWLVKLLSSVLSLPNTLTHHEQETNTMASVIVQRAEGKEIDGKYLDIAMGERDEYMGYAFVEDGEIKYGEMPLENKAEVKEEISTTLNHPLVLSFDKDVKSEESKQPFVTVTKEDGTPLCVTFMDGDFQGFGAPESSHSLAWNAHQEYLMSKIVEIFTDNDEDLDKVFAKLNRANTKSEILNNCFPGTLANGNVVIMFANGKFLSFYKGDKHKKYEWGETSLAFGYEAKPVASEAVKKGLGAHSKTTSKSSVPAVEAKKPDTAMTAALAKAEDKKTGLEYIIVPPPHVFKSAQSLEEWCTKFTDPTQKPTNAEINEYKGQAHKFKGLRVKPSLSNAAFNTLLEKGFFLMAPNQDKPVDKKVETKIELPMIVIPTAEREKLDKDFWPKIASGDSKLVADPVEINKFFNGKPSASEQLGRQMGVREFEVLTADGFGLLMKTAPEAAKAVFVQMQQEIYRTGVALRKASETRKAM